MLYRSYKCISFILFGLLLLAFSRALAQRLNARHYDTRDGLAHSRIHTFHQDMKGYLWIGTWEGLSRFDGYRFVNYDTRDGLGHVFINSIAEDKHGRLWLGTNGGGVSRLIDDPSEARSLSSGDQKGSAKKFVSFQVGDSAASNKVNVLILVSDVLWCGTDDGIYRSISSTIERPEFECVVPHNPAYAAFLDRQGRLWFGCENELIGFVGGGIVNYRGADDVVFENINSLAEDHSGRLFLTDNHGLFEFMEPDSPQSSPRWKRLPLSLQSENFGYRLFIASDGTLWISSAHGVIKYSEGKELQTTAEGLTGEIIDAIYQDRDGNLWVGTFSSGVSKLSGDMAVIFTRTEGLPDQHVVRVIESHHGHIYGSTRSGLVEFLEGVARTIPGSQSSPFNTIGTRIIQDRHGDWWVAGQGLYRFRGPALQLRVGNKLTASHGIPDVEISVLYEDPQGRIWVGSKEGLYYSDQQTGSAVFKHIPLGTVRWPISLATDRTGRLWVSGFGGLDRFSDGVMRSIQTTDGLPETETRSLFLDSRGWLWIGLRNRGVSMTKEPTAESPEFVNFSTADGLASDFVLSIAEDDAGRIYVGTFKGLDRLDPSTGKIQHFTTADGLAGDTIEHCLKDRRGNYWVATNMGVSKLNLVADREVKRPPPIYLSSIQIAGEDLPLAETGTARAAVADLSASRNNLLIEFVGLSFEREGGLKYQYRLEGADADWGVPTEQRTVNYAQLAPGRYRFLVRAINRQGIASTEPAVFEFRILPPIWQRWWLLTLAAILIAMAAYAFHRYRVARLVEVERIRTRIATDLHDDIGSSLSQIAILSEVARNRVRRVDYGSDKELSTIARISRESVDAMSDIVWAINPQRDWLGDLVGRMRRFAGEIFPPRDIEFQFTADLPEPDTRLTSDLRRQIFLIFKECVNNIVRHSECTQVSIGLSVEGSVLVMRLHDNGKGFDESTANSGHGLMSMRRRAAILGGELQIGTNDSDGTAVTLRVQLSRRSLRQGA